VARGNKGRRTEIVTVLAFDRVIGLFSMLLIPLFFAPFFPLLIRREKALQALLVMAAGLAACLLATFLLCLLTPPWINRAVQWGSRFFSASSLPERIIATIRVYRTSPQILLAALGAALASNLILIAVSALAVSLLNPSSLSMKMCLVVPLGDIANALPLTPGGLGVGETAFSALFHIAGLQGGAEALLCWRIWRALAGLAGLVPYLRGVERLVFDSRSSIAEEPSRFGDRQTLAERC
jgi:glycosyltransferase 2 family protein